jgi:hypothetical protein
VSTNTQFLSLVKPAVSEAYDVAIVNTNMDVIDSMVGPRSTSGSAVTVANTTTETSIAGTTLPANAAAIGRVFKLVVVGQAGVTGTPTLTFRARIGGVTGALLGTVVVTAASGVTGKAWRAEAELICVTTGVSGTWLGAITVIDELGNTLPSAANVGMITTPVTKDTTIAEDLTISVQWSAANALNTATRYFRYGSMVASN